MYWIPCIISQCFHPLATATRINNYKAEQEQMNIQSDKLNSNLMENLNCRNLKLVRSKNSEKIRK
jgi:hypothetical protein